MEQQKIDMFLAQNAEKLPKDVWTQTYNTHPHL
jgi:hypothetical protein